MHSGCKRKCSRPRASVGPGSFAIDRSLLAAPPFDRLQHSHSEIRLRNYRRIGPAFSLQFIHRQRCRAGSQGLLRSRENLLSLDSDGIRLDWYRFCCQPLRPVFRQLSASESHLPTRTTGLSVWSGVTLVGLGVIVILSSVLRHFQLIRELKSGIWIPGRVSRDAVLLGLLLAAAGIGMCVYLVLVH